MATAGAPSAAAPAAAVVVTGAAGRLGLAIAQALRKAGHRVVGVDRPGAPGATEAARQLDGFVLLDLAGDAGPTGAKLCEVFAGVDAVVHCAAWPGPSATPPPAVVASGRSCPDFGIGLEDTSPSGLLRDNVMMTACLCEAAVAAGVRRVVFSSSAFAIGWSHVGPTAQGFIPASLPIDEKHAPRPFESYGLSKAMGEAVLETAARTALHTSFVSLRFPNVIKGEKWDSMPWPAPTADKPLPMLMWAYAHEDDVVEAHVNAVTLGDVASKSGHHETYIIAAPDTRFAAPTMELLDVCVGKGVVDASLPGRASILSSAKAIQRLGVRPRSWAGTAQPGCSLHPIKGNAAVLAARADPNLEHFSLDGFKLDSGLSLGPGATLAYRVYGAPPDESAGRGLILHPTSFDAVHTEVDEEVGPGKMLDIDRYCVVVMNMLGNGISFSPSTSPMYPPARSSYPSLITVGDNVRAQAAALHERFGTNKRCKVGEGSDCAAGRDLIRPPRLSLIYGYSMGALQALEWAVRFPDAVARVAAVCGTARCAPINDCFLLSLEAALCADPAWHATSDNGAGYFESTPSKGLKAFARIYSGWGIGSKWYEDDVFKHFGFESAESFIRDSYEATLMRSDRVRHQFLEVP